MKLQLQQALAKIQSAITDFNGINQLSGNIDNTVFDPLYSFMTTQVQDPNAPINQFVATATPLVAAIPDGV